jgi:DNA transformation protein
MARKPRKTHKLLDRALPALQAVGAARARAMFGGFGIYLDDVIVGIIAWDRLFFRVDGRNRPDYQAAGTAPFTYEGRGGKPIEMPYWEVPAEVLAEPARLADWATKARAASLAARASKKARAKPRG